MPISTVSVAATVVDSPQQTIDHPLALASVVVLLIGVTAVTTALMDAEWQFRTESALDPLTGLLNRVGFTQQIDGVLDSTRAGEARVGLLFIDLNDFKAVNDTRGHRAGDQ